MTKLREFPVPADSDHHSNHRFHNLSPTTMMSPDYSFARIFRDYFNRPADSKPAAPLRSIVRDLRVHDNDHTVITWFGHSSYLIQAPGLTILTDPVFSRHASPVSFLVKAFEGSNVYRVDDLPMIDLLILTHDHYDHFDIPTLRKLRSKLRRAVVPPGVGAQLRPLIGEEPVITELDWWQTCEPFKDTLVTALPARHFAGRGLIRDKTLWCSYALRIGQYKIYAGGDSGYDTHFKTIGKQEGPFDLAILECGQYNEGWPQIHMFPEQTWQAAGELGARYMMPVHWGKFALANHGWTEPVKRLLAAAATTEGSGAQQITDPTPAAPQITTPMIGEPVILGKSYPASHWWE